MKWLVVVGLAAVAALTVGLGLASPASAYPEVTCNVTVDHQRVASGGTFTATGTAASASTTWLMTWHGQSRTGSGETFVQSFTAPRVKKPTSFRLVAKATSASGTCQHALNVAVLPAGAVDSPSGVSPDGATQGVGGTIPNAGGPRLILLLAGLGLVVAGGLAIRQSRKGDEGPTD